jgi:hypothetical protein
MNWRNLATYSRDCIDTTNWINIMEKMDPGTLQILAKRKDKEHIPDELKVYVPVSLGQEFLEVYKKMLEELLEKSVALLKAEALKL